MDGWDSTFAALQHTHTHTLTRLIVHSLTGEQRSKVRGPYGETIPVLGAEGLAALLLDLGSLRKQFHRERKHSGLPLFWSSITESVGRRLRTYVSLSLCCCRRSLSCQMRRVPGLLRASRVGLEGEEGHFGWRSVLRTTRGDKEDSRRVLPPRNNWS